MNLLGTPNIGVYALTTNDYAIVPQDTTERKARIIEACLQGQIIRINIGGTRLSGVLSAANSKGIVLPKFASDEDIRTIKSVLSVNVGRIESRITAFGNLVLANDRGGIVSKILAKEKTVLKKVEDILDVELIPGEIAGLPYVGSLAVATNKGVLAHPMLKDEERELLQQMLKVRIDVGTTNGGCPFVASGILANDNGVLIGNLTTGPEILMISNVLE